MLPLTLAGGAAALTSDGDKLPATAPVAAAPTVMPIRLKNSLRAIFGISGMPANFVMTRFPFGIAGSASVLHPRLRLRWSLNSIPDVATFGWMRNAALQQSSVTPAFPESTRPG